ncbi:hypothetical protein EK21DRAFT_112191 [Setomelanomma holmii]|uniref:Uncharacterized protein n=1 Tax=Setomelanomma holmii TaxID=210430 RepID=A0A9P4H9Q9_9PLEO|nr:hypothetical protein EK21DRAFT_112191 [Setomelanomma holmii]
MTRQGAPQSLEDATVRPDALQLLTLPGEIRNHVYTFACDHNEVKLTRSPSCKVQENPQEELSEGRQFYNLTQVCRQIRTEFLPIYRHTSKVRLQYIDLPAYLKDCVIHPSDEAASIGNITFDVFSDGEMSDNEDYRPVADGKIDILPVMMLCKHGPNLHIRCGTIACKWCGSKSHRSDFEDTLNALFRLQEHPALAEYLKDAVAAAKLQYPPRLTFEIRGDHWKSWMKDWKAGHSVNFGNEDMKSWCEGVGLRIDSLAGASRFERHGEA